MPENEVISLESEIGFRALFENATIGILVVGQNGGIELVNPHAEKLFDYSNAELIGKPVEILIPQSVASKHHHHRDGYFEKPKSRPMGRGIDLFARKKDGSVFPVEISLGYYELAGQKLAMAFISDITQRKEAENELKKINDQLEERVQQRTLELTAALEREMELNNMKSRFVSFASHEFRTPLTTILSSISLVEIYLNQAPSEKTTKHIERIKSSIKLLTDILNDFLSLDKLEQGKIEIENQEQDLKELIDETVEDIKQIMKAGQQVHFNHTGPAEIFHDSKILRNVLINLLSNAIKYSPEGNAVYIESEVSNGLVTIHVKASGIGIPEDEQKHLFQKFYRASNASSMQGTGLGLNIVQRYVELMGGQIGFTSKSGVGTVFTVQFRQNHH